MPSRTLELSAPTDTDVPDVRLDSHRRDAAGRPIDPERYHHILEAEAAKLGLDVDELHVERFDFPAAPHLVCLRVVDRQGAIHGITGFPWEAMEPEIPDRMIERAKRGRAPRPNIRLVG